ncbi:MAG: hypothetical protein ABR548_03605 [Actinomycetota bacterium]|nr:hypothetical protein [Actinomycetota bacterium]
MTALLLPVQAHAAAWDNDCGSGSDTGPSLRIPIPSGGSCSGSMDGEGYGWAGPGCSFVCAMDGYSFDATIDDAVTISFGSPCSHWFVSSVGGGTTTTTFVAPSTGTFSVNITAESGFDGGGCSGSTSYSVGIRVIPNTRPSVSIVSAPATALPGDPTNFTIVATDPENNLKRDGVTVHPGSQTTWKTPDATGHATFTLSFGASSTLDFKADDVFGAVATPVTHAVTLVENDCGTGADVTLASEPFPFTCHGHLTPSLGDNQDSFTFTVPSGTDRVAAGLARTSGALSRRLVLTSPTNVVYTGLQNGNVYAPAETGTWQLNVDRISTFVSGVDTSFGGYNLNVRAIGPLSAPSLTASVSKATPHWWEPLTLSFVGTDPNSLPMWYSVGWDDGTSQRVPASGLIGSDLAQVLTHEYSSASTGARAITVTVTSDDGTTASTSIPITVLAPDDRCGDDTTAAADAPESGSAFPYPKFEHEFAAQELWHCAGELGYTLAKSGTTVTTDAKDMVRFAACYTNDRCGEIDNVTGAPFANKMRVTLRTGSTLGATVTLSIGTLVNAFSATAPPGGVATIDLPLTQPVFYWYAAISPTSGAGTYTVDVELLPPV